MGGMACRRGYCWGKVEAADGLAFELAACVGTLIVDGLTSYAPAAPMSCQAHCAQLCGWLLPFHLSQARC